MARAEIHLEVLKDEVNYENNQTLLKWIIRRVEKRAGKK
jgi:hypothetical protein